MMIFAAALAAAPAASNAAPRSINDCEKIDAADAYNQCLAAFGPVAHTHGVKADAQEQDEANAEDGASAEPTSGRTVAASPRQRVAHAHGRHGRHGSQHAWSRHGHGHHASSADHSSHAHAKKLAFTVVSGHTKLR